MAIRIFFSRWVVGGQGKRIKIASFPGSTLGSSVVPRRLPEEVGPASRRTMHASRVRSPDNTPRSRTLCQIVCFLDAFALVGGIVPGIVLLMLCGCGSTITARIQPPRSGSFAEDIGSSPRFDPAMTNANPTELVRWAGFRPDRLCEAADILLQRAPRQKRTSQGGRSGWALAACAVAWKSLVASDVPAARWSSDPRTREAVTLYRNALTLFVSENARILAPGQNTLEYQTPLGLMSVTPRYATSRFSPGYFDTLLPSDWVRETGITGKVAPSGLGTPLVGVRKRTSARAEEMRFQVPGNDLHVALGSLARFRTSRAGRTTMSLDFYDLAHSPAATLRGDRVTLAGDFTTPLALTFVGTNDLRVGIHALFNLDAGFGHEGIYMTEPFDPDRIPVLLLHGLLASPLAWRNVVADCLEAPEIRKNYQFWYGFFSAGMPLTTSAALIRADIAALRQTGDPGGTSRASRNMIVVGHSMGGVIARALATDIGNHYWETLTDQPFARATMKPRDRETIRSWFFWPPATDIKKIIFLATPHHGTAIADNIFVRLGQNTMELPKTMFEINKRVASGDEPVPDNDHLRIFTKSFTKAFADIRTGIDSIAPQAPIYRAFTRAPLVAGVSTHSLMGDRGRGDTPDSSDGVVGYRSSHLDSAQSELILPSNHELQQDPRCGPEIRRILLESLDPKNTPVRSPGFPFTK